MDLQFEKSNLANRNTLEVLDQVFVDLELGFLFCSGPPYLTIEPEFRKIWSKPRVEQIALLAGPIENRCLIK
jgi:hypothetical protein